MYIWIQVILTANTFYITEFIVYNSTWGLFENIK